MSFLKSLLGIGPSIGEIQAAHYEQAQQCLHDAMSTNSQPNASRLWGEFCQHMDDAGYRGASSYPSEIHVEVVKFVTGNYDPLDYSGGHYSEENNYHSISGKRGIVYDENSNDVYLSDDMDKDHRNFIKWNRR